MAHYHVLVWLDHHEAKIFHFNAAEMGELRVMPDKPHVHVHHHRGSNTDGHAKEDQHYYHNVAAAITDAGEVLKLVGVETVDHPSDKQLVAHARRYFLATDRMKPQRG